MSGPLLQKVSQDAFDVIDETLTSDLTECAEDRMIELP